MRTHLLPLLCVLAACASISGSQAFETTQLLTLPEVAGIPRDAGTQTIRAMAAVTDSSFAESVLDDVDELRERDHVDSAEASVRIVTIQLSSDTTFSGVKAIRVELVTAEGAIELCNRTLTADEQRASSISCEADQVIDEATLQASAGTETPARIGAQLDVAGAEMTAKELRSVVRFEVEVDLDASL